MLSNRKYDKLRSVRIRKKAMRKILTLPAGQTRITEFYGIGEE